MALEFTTRPPDVRFATTGIPPPTSVYITPSDSLRVHVWNSAPGAVVIIMLRVLQADGQVVPMAYRMTPATDRSQSQLTQSLPEGFLLGATAYMLAGTARRGQTYCNAFIMRAIEGSVAVVGTMLWSGYLAEGGVLAWPPTVLADAVEGPGIIRSIVGTNPAAGVEISETVPTRARWRLIGVRYTYVAAGVGSARVSRLTVDDGANVLVRIDPATTQAIGTTNQYTWGDTLARAAPVSSEFVTEIGRASMLLAGWRVRTDTLNLNAADDYSSPQLWVEEWIEP